MACHGLHKQACPSAEGCWLLRMLSRLGRWLPSQQQQPSQNQRNQKEQGGERSGLGKWLEPWAASCPIRKGSAFWGGARAQTGPGYHAGSAQWRCGGGRRQTCLLFNNLERTTAIACSCTRDFSRPWDSLFLSITANRTF